MNTREHTNPKEPTMDKPLTELTPGDLIHNNARSHEPTIYLGSMPHPLLQRRRLTLWHVAGEGELRTVSISANATIHHVTHTTDKDRRKRIRMCLHKLNLRTEYARAA